MGVIHLVPAFLKAFSAATPAGPTVGVPPLPPAQPANHHPILS